MIISEALHSNRYAGTLKFQTEVLGAREDCVVRTEFVDVMAVKLGGKLHNSAKMIRAGLILALAIILARLSFFFRSGSNDMGLSMRVIMNSVSQSLLRRTFETLLTKVTLTLKKHFEEI